LHVNLERFSAEDIAAPAGMVGVELPEKLAA
jgi:hypothetical protein